MIIQSALLFLQLTVGTAANASPVETIDIRLSEAESIRGRDIYESNPQYWNEIFEQWMELTPEQKLVRELRWMRALNRWAPRFSHSSLNQVAYLAFKSELGQLPFVEAIKALRGFGEELVIYKTLSTWPEKHLLSLIGRHFTDRIAAMTSSQRFRLLRFEGFSFTAVMALRKWVEFSIENKNTWLRVFPDWSEESLSQIEEHWYGLLKFILEERGIVKLANAELGKSVAHGGAERLEQQELLTAMGTAGRIFNKSLEKFLQFTREKQQLRPELLELYFNKVALGTVSYRRSRWLEVVGESAALERGLAGWIKKTRLESPPTHWMGELEALYPELLYVRDASAVAEIRNELGIWVGSVLQYLPLLRALEASRKQSLLEILNQLAAMYRFEIKDEILMALRPELEKALEQALCHRLFSKLD